MTPLIIKETLGQEIYDLFEKYRKQPKEDRTIHIICSAEGQRIFEDAIKQEYDRINK